LSTIAVVRSLVEARKASFGEKHWFDPKADDDYVYHGAQTKHLDHIKKHGITAFLRTYFATDPKVSMQYGYRPSLHHPSDSKKLHGVLLRVHKKHVDPEEYKRHSRSREDFWTGGDISPDKIEIHKGGGKWKPLSP
jgi:hypothetical protein